ncbi:hypothetical protein [Microbacterium sp.]|uniref:hypothetical protein n=1 Tax=Microbacterium sp. TaxID=51671 RepID=UPI0039E3DA01
MRRTLTLAATALAACALAACATDADGTGAPASTASTRPPFLTTTPGTIAPTGTPADVPEARWDALVADLAARGVTATPVLISAEEVTFSDGSLGCASPGQSYTQALVDGMRVVVTADGQIYDYRFGEGTTLTLCER